MLRIVALKTAAASIAAVLAFSLPQPASQAAAESSEYEVSLLTFPVTINETAIDRLHSPYPLLLYRDITYFPMTWEYTSALGLNVAWNEQTGLSLAKNEACSPVRQTLSAQTGSSSSGSTTAIPAPFQVKVNGALIDPTKEDYPVLFYNNITYFPLSMEICT